MSVVGIDVGSLNSVIAVARSGGVDVICNEVSDRSTPSMVSFDHRRRFIGDAAKTQQVGNFRNTVASLPRLLGMSEGAEQFDIEKSYLTCETTSKDARVAVAVDYHGEAHVFNDVELMGMLLGKLQSITCASTGVSALDCVLSVPGYYGEIERRSMLDAAQVAGLNCLSLINDLTAVALCYGLTRADIQEVETVRNVCFVDVGYSSTQVSVVTFGKGSLEVRGYAFDMNLGGRDFDEKLAQYFADGIVKKFGVDAARQSKKSLLRLRVACEKIKKVLSGVGLTRLELESLFDGQDVPLEMSRQQFEDLTGELIIRIIACVTRALEQAGIAAKDVHSCEIVGGTTRIPSIKEALSNIFGKEPSTTLNQDEAVARGCAFKCAMESPNIRVRPYSIKELLSKQVELILYSPEHNGVRIESLEKVSLPWNKCLQFSDSLPIKLEVQMEGRPIASFGIPAQTRTANPLQVHLSITNQELVIIKKIVAVEEIIEVTNAETGETRKTLREYPIKWENNLSSLSTVGLQNFRDQEFQFALNDKHAAELDDSKNAVEEYIYEMINKVEDQLRPFVSDKDAQIFVEMLDQAEAWLYSEEHDDPSKISKDVYVKKLNELRRIGTPIVIRAREHEERPRAEALLRQLANSLIEKAKAINLEDVDRNKILSECNAKLEWLDGQLAERAKLPLYEDSKLTVASISEQREKLLKSTKDLFAKVKKVEETPVPPKPVTDEASKEEAIPNMEVD